MSFSPVNSIADTPDLEDGNGDTLTYSSGSITTGDINNIGLESSETTGKGDHGIYILDSLNVQMDLSGVIITTYGYNADGVLFTGSASDSNTINMSSVSLSWGTME